MSTNTVFHYVVPIMMIVGWLAFGPRPWIDRQTIVRSMVWPVLWFGYTVVHGAGTQWYPYPFVDPHTEGYVRVAVNALLVMVVLVAAAGLFAVGDRKLPPRLPPSG